MSNVRPLRVQVFAFWAPATDHVIVTVLCPQDTQETLSLVSPGNCFERGKKLYFCDILRCF